MRPLHRLLWRVALTLLVGLAAPLQAAPVSLDAFDGRSLEVLIDPAGSMTVDDVQRATAWAPVTSPKANYGFSAATYWFRVVLRNAALEPQQRLLEVESPLLDALDIHWFDAQGQPLQRWALGDKQPFDARPIPHRTFVVPLYWPAQTERQLVMRVRTSGTVQMPAKLWTPQAFEHARDRDVMFQGVYFGAMFAMVAYNLLLFFAVRDRSYLWYVAWSSTVTVFVGALTGLTFQLLWPQATQWNDISLLLFLSLALGAGCMFTRSFLDLPVAAPRTGRLVAGLAAIAGACAVGAFFVPYALLVRVLALLAIVLAVVGFAIATWRLRHGFGPALYYLLGWTFVLLGGVVLALTRAGLLPSNDWTENATQIGSAIEVIMLALALAARFNNERRLREKAQADAIRVQLEANEKLDLRVRERTAELERVNALLHEISQTDGLTGVHNRRHLDEVLTIESQRASRGSGPLGVILIDIDHFKRINDTHGHAAGDECLKQVARVIRQHARRNTDLVARYGGEEFCAVMPGVGVPEALAIAEHLRARIEQTVFQVDGIELKLTASLGVCARIPQSADDAQRMLKDADQALYESKHRGRNRVTAAHVPPVLAATGR